MCMNNADEDKMKSNKCKPNPDKKNNIRIFHIIRDAKQKPMATAS